MRYRLSQAALQAALAANLSAGHVRLTKWLLAATPEAVTALVGKDLSESSLYHLALGKVRFPSAGVRSVLEDRLRIPLDSWPPREAPLGRKVHQQPKLLLVGKTVGSLHVVAERSRGHHMKGWEVVCQCSCGATVVRRRDSLLKSLRDGVKNLTCQTGPCRLPQPAPNALPKRTVYGDLTVTHVTLRKRGKRMDKVVQCRCRCGDETTRVLHTLVRSVGQGLKPCCNKCLKEKRRKVAERAYKLKPVYNGE